MWLMQLGEVIFGGVGSGLYRMIVFAIVAVFLAGLMVGRTTLPTYTPLFILLLVAVVIVVGALTFFPALALGPIVEHLMLAS